MISYYDLLGMIKDKNNPKKIKYDGDLYEFNDNLNCYRSETGNCYLSEGFDEDNAFAKVIEIIEKPKKLEKLDILKQQVTIANHYSKDNIQCIVNEFYRRYSVLINKINAIIEVLNEKEKIQDNQE